MAAIADGLTEIMFMSAKNHKKKNPTRRSETDSYFPGADEIGIYLAGSGAAFRTRCAFVSQLLGKISASLR